MKSNSQLFGSVIFFSTTNGTSGNDSNLIQNNDITKGTLAPVICIRNIGTGATSAAKNSDNRIIGNRNFHCGIKSFETAKN